MRGRRPGAARGAASSSTGSAASGELAGHALGNLLITALWEETGDIVTGLDWVAALLGAHGRVLPVATTPLQVVAQVAGLHPDDPSIVERVVGQVAVATTPGEVVALRLEPADAKACPEAIEAIADADGSCSAPARGSPACSRRCRCRHRAGGGRRAGRVIVILNLAPQPGETSGFSPQRHLEVLRAVPGLRVDTVVADPARVSDVEALASAASALGARLVLAAVASRDGSPRHDADLLASALGGVLTA